MTNVGSSEITMDLNLLYSGYYLAEVKTVAGMILRTKILISK